MVAILPLEPIAAIVAANWVGGKVKKGEVLRSVPAERVEQQVGSETGKDGGAGPALQGQLGRIG